MFCSPSLPQSPPVSPVSPSVKSVIQFCMAEFDRYVMAKMSQILKQSFII
ncbi:Eukaryotic translation initiation factor 4B [Crocosphaera watsonii WH 0402]|nr:Eukaryotic translation initiation factor 4B [Crocosphaera watsonii WH 0402]